jgi:hypothetical protein
MWMANADFPASNWIYPPPGRLKSPSDGSVDLVEPGRGRKQQFWPVGHSGSNGAFNVSPEHSRKLLGESTPTPETWWKQLDEWSH